MLAKGGWVLKGSTFLKNVLEVFTRACVLPLKNVLEYLVNTTLKGSTFSRVAQSSKWSVARSRCSYFLHQLRMHFSWRRGLRSHSHAVQPC